MDQTEFQKALQKFQKRKAKQAIPAPLPNGAKVNTALPFEVIVPPAKKEKPAEQPRPRHKDLEVTITGPVELKCSIDWGGTLMGGQMNPQAMKTLLAKHLAPFGRVTFK